MSKPIRIQRKRSRGFKLISPNGLPIVYVGRPSWAGNPYRVTDKFTAEQAVRAFTILVNKDKDLRARIKAELRGKNLSDWCPLDQPCHADILLEIANE